jgi:ABC-type multidrug transport system fused ATPase/permease subunit
VWCACALSQPELIALTVAHLTSNPSDSATTTTTVWHGISYALLLFVCGIGYAWSINVTFTILCRFGTQIKATMQSVLFDKALRLHVSSQNADVGAWTNLVSNDTDAIFQCIKFLHYPILSTIFVCTVLGMMIRTVSLVPALCGFGTLLLVLPLNACVSARIGNIKQRMISETDERTDLISQVLEGMEAIKAWSLEPAFATRIEVHRETELKHAMSIHMLDAVLKVILFSVPSLVAVLTIYLAHVMGQPLSLVVVLKMLSYLNILRFPLLIIPLALGNIFQAVVSLRRVEDFMLLPEAPKKVSVLGSDDSFGDEDSRNLSLPILDVNSATFSWQPEYTSTRDAADASHPFVLTRVNLRLRRGSLCGVVGSVGSGKTLLCHGILRELDGSVGAVNVRTKGGTVAFASQTPQILNQTIRENILFGQPEDGARLARCVRASCLDVDVDAMKLGLDTVLGERGINLSGGQKARVAFARTLYAATLDPANSVALLDDPLSAVDVEVGAEMWRRGVLGELRDNGVTTVIVLSSRIKEFLERDADVICELVEDTRVGSESESKVAGTMTVAVRAVERGDVATEMPPASEEDEAATCRTVSVSMVKEVQTISEDTLPAEKESSIIVAEKRDVGRVRFSVWRTYLALVCSAHGNSTINDEDVDGDAVVSEQPQPSLSGDYDIGRSTSVGILLGTVLVSVYLIAQGFKTLLDLSLVWFGEEGGNTPPWILALEWSENDWIWALFVGVFVVFGVSLGRSMFGVTVLLRSSRQMHRAVLKNVLRAPLLYFQRRPTGRILNKFSSDMLKADLVLPMIGCSLIENLSSLINALVLSIVSVPWLLLVVIPALSLLALVVNMFRASSREIGRLDSEARSPLYSAFSTVLSSRVSIRSFQQSVSFMRQSTQRAIDRSSSVFLISVLMVRWNSFRLNAIMTGYSASLFAAAALLKEASESAFVPRAEYANSSAAATNVSNVPVNSGGDGLFTDPAVVGLALVYSLQLLGLSSFTAITFIGTESGLTSVERIFQFLGMPQEKARIKRSDPARGAPRRGSASDTLPSVWPSAGQITLKNLRLRYRPDLPLALKGLDLTVQPGEKLGIVGRTGAGKSSLFRALLRLTEPEPGTMMKLDGVDLMSIGLHRLRHGAVTIIPQMPVVFSGSVRFNVDPYGMCEDEVIWNMLEDVSPSLAQVIRSREGGLNSACGRNGTFFLTWAASDHRCGTGSSSERYRRIPSGRGDFEPR